MSAASGLTVGLAAAAGVVTVASPCVLPMLPLLLGGGTAGTARWRPLAVVAGFVAAFAGVALAFAASAEAAGLSHAAVRQVAAVALAIAGVLMVRPAWGDRAMRVFWPLADAAHRVSGRGRGLGGALLQGAALGALWTPCAGPVLASILALAATAGPVAETTPLLLAYALGTAGPMLAIAYGGQALSQRLGPLRRHAVRIRQAFGVLVIGTAAALLAGTGGPGGGLPALPALSLPSLAWPVLDLPADAAQPVAAGDPAPEFTGIDHWLNGPPLRMDELRGRVVLVDFWTFGCRNCLNTLPHIRALHATHGPEGLVVIGVHTPEFGHERPRAAVEAAVRRLGVGYPVAQDNGYATWNAYRNRYWPAVYLVGRDGRIAARFFGEGHDAAIDATMQRLLAEPAP